MKNKAHRPPLGPPAVEPVFPAALLLRGRHCLIVGGGKVAERKARLLLETGADLTVVSPRFRPVFRAHAASGRLRLVEREFQRSDVAGAFLVFAATDDAKVNRDVLRACREAGALCCAADNSWACGDFVTPAIFRDGEFTVAVCSGGVACRKSRIIKESVARRANLLASSELVMAGVDHESLELKKREKFQLDASRIHECGDMLAQLWGMQEFLLLSTCNRFELMAATSCDRHTLNAVLRLTGLDRAPPAALRLCKGHDAFLRAAMLLAGLLSQAKGERHIVAQVKAALELALSRKWAGPILKEWIGSAAHVARHIRASAGPLLENVEIEDLCMSALESEIQDLKRSKALVIGAGVTGRGMVARCTGRGMSCDWIFHRQRPSSGEAERLKAKIFPLSRLAEQLKTADIVICAAAAQTPILREEHLRLLRRKRQVWIVDLGVPRNVAFARSAASANIRLLNLEDLKRLHAADNLLTAEIEARAHAIAAEHNVLYEKIIRSFKGRQPSQHAGAAPDQRGA